MKIKALMIAAALLAAADVHAAPQKAKTAPAKAVKAAATAQKEAAPAQQQGGIRFSDGIAAVADNEVITNRFYLPKPLPKPKPPCPKTRR